MSLMSNMFVGTNGLQTSQNALNTVAHNMANVNTDGYTRQQISLGTRGYITYSTSQSANAYTQSGLGATYMDCRQVRDSFLDASYRLENGRGSFYSTSYEAINEIEDELQEMNGTEFADAISNLWTSAQNLANDPTSSVNQSSFITRSGEFIQKAQSVYNGLVSYQSSLDDNVSTMVSTINKYGDQIYNINQQIMTIESSGVEDANDLRDQRNLLLDELSTYGKISYEEDSFGAVTVQFEGTQFVTGDHVNHMACDTSESSAGYNTPYWEFAAKKYTDADGNEKTDISSAHVLNLSQTVSSAMNTDVGKLRSTLLARGDHNATYHDIQDSTDYYNDNISQSVIMNTEAEFDQLFNNIVTAINDVMKNMDSNPATLSGEGSTSDYVMFKMTDENSTLSYTIDDSHKAGENQTGFTISNTTMNSLLEETPTLNTFITSEGNADNDAATALKAVFTNSDYTLNPNVTTKTNLNDYYNSLVSQIANSGEVMKSISESQNSTVTSVSDAREQIVGTSSDEEMEHMIAYQNAYNASSRYINVVSELLENLVTSLGNA